MKIKDRVQKLRNVYKSKLDKRCKQEIMSVIPPNPSLNYKLMAALILLNQILTKSKEFQEKMKYKQLEKWCKYLLEEKETKVDLLLDDLTISEISNTQGETEKTLEVTRLFMEIDLLKEILD